MLQREAYQYRIEGSAHTWEVLRPCLHKARRTAPLVRGPNLRQTRVSPYYIRPEPPDATSDLSLTAPDVQDALRPTQAAFYSRGGFAVHIRHLPLR